MIYKYVLNYYVSFQVSSKNFYYCIGHQQSQVFCEGHHQKHYLGWISKLMFLGCHYHYDIDIG